MKRLMQRLQKTTEQQLSSFIDNNNNKRCITDAIQRCILVRRRYLLDVEPHCLYVAPRTTGAAAAAGPGQPTDDAPSTQRRWQRWCPSVTAHRCLRRRRRSG